MDRRARPLKQKRDVSGYLEGMVKYNTSNTIAINKMEITAFQLIIFVCSPPTNSGFHGGDYKRGCVGKDRGARRD